MQTRIYLIGFMGSGKSHTGKLLAPRLGFSFHDLDQMIEEAAGTDIAGIFRKQGENAFRALEAECLRKTAHLERAVISCGGGAPCHEGNMEWMNRHGLTIFLDPSVDILAARLLPRRFHRPLIRHLDSFDKMKSFVSDRLLERLPDYEKADLHYRPENGDLEAADDLEPIVLKSLRDV